MYKNISKHMLQQQTLIIAIDIQLTKSIPISLIFSNETTKIPAKAEKIVNIMFLPFFLLLFSYLHILDIY